MPQSDPSYSPTGPRAEDTGTSLYPYRAERLMRPGDVMTEEQKADREYLWTPDPIPFIPNRMQWEAQLRHEREQAEELEQALASRELWRRRANQLADIAQFFRSELACANLTDEERDFDHAVKIAHLNKIILAAEMICDEQAARLELPEAHGGAFTKTYARQALAACGGLIRQMVKEYR